MTSKSPDNKDKETTDEILTELVRAGVFEQKDYHKLLTLTGLAPSKLQWLRFLYGFVFSLATVFMLLGIILFFAWNWSDLGAYEKLMLVEGILLFSGVCALITNGEKLSGQLSFTVMCVMTGVVLAVYGQIYQTGADNYRLFVSWSLLIIIPVMIVRFAPLWIFWIALTNLALILWVSQSWFGSITYLRIGLALGITNFILLLIWSAYIGCHSSVLRHKVPRWLELIFRLFIPLSDSSTVSKQPVVTEPHLWMYRIIYIVGLFWLTVTLFHTISNSPHYYSQNIGFLEYFTIAIVFLYLFTIGIAQYLAQKILKDLFIYTISLFSICTLISISFATFVNINRYSFWLLSLFIIFLSIAAAHWLRKVQNNWKIDS